MGAFVEGVLHPHLQCNLFPSPLFPLIDYGLKHQFLNAMEIKEHRNAT
jgi:hypothetical protein